MTDLRNISKFIILGLVPVIIALFYNTISNQHVHLINGKVVAHAHPYSKENPGPVQHHNHTPGLCNLLLLTGENYTAGSVTPATLYFYQNNNCIEQHLYADYNTNLICRYVAVLTLRGPPNQV